MNRARTAAAALFRRVFLINGLIFVLGTLILALSPATVSSRIKLTEIPVLVVGLAIMLTANALLLRRSLAPMLKWERTTASASTDATSLGILPPASPPWSQLESDPLVQHRGHIAHRPAVGDGAASCDVLAAPEHYDESTRHQPRRDDEGQRTEILLPVEADPSGYTTCASLCTASYDTPPTGSRDRDGQHLPVRVV